MAAAEKLLVVVGIHEGKDFPPLPGQDLVIEVRFAGETLQTDPVDHSNGGHIEINNELAWELTKKSLQEHKLQRTPVKILCYCVKKYTNKKIEYGTILLDLRSVQNQAQPTVSHWYGLLRSQYVGKRPELKISLTLETISVDSSTTENVEQQNDSLSSSSSSSSSPPTAPTPMVLDETNGWYLIGTPNASQLLYTVSLTLTKPQNLHTLMSINAMGPYHFKYNLLGNMIVTEDFTDLNEPTDFQAERASVRIKATKDHIHQLLMSQSDIQIDLIGNNDKVYLSGAVPIKPLTASSCFSVSCSLKSLSLRGSVNDVATPTINVTLAMKQEKITGKVNEVNQNTDLSVSTSNNTNGTTVTTTTVTEPTVSNTAVLIPTSSSSSTVEQEKTAKRNLTQSFEEVSNSSTVSIKSSSPPPTSYAPSVSINKTPPAPGSPTITTPTVSVQPKLTFTSPRTSPLVMSQSAMDPKLVKKKKKSTNEEKVEVMQLRRSLKSQTSETTDTKQGSSSVPTIIISTEPDIVSNKSTITTINKSTLSNTGQTVPHDHQQQLEYQAAMDLEIWKMTQEQLFKDRLKEKEDAHMKLIAEEFKKRDKHREDFMKQKMEHYQSLEDQLAKALKELETQRHKLRTREHELSSTQKRLEEERKVLQFDIERERNRMKMEFEGNLQIERLKYQELCHQLERAKKQINELESRLSQRDVEFQSYKEQMDIKPESKLQAEIGLLKLEKNELEHKLEAATKSKQHYKEQWNNALKDVAALKYREQTVLRDQLKKQQLELEAMRENYLQAEQQQMFQRQLENLKQETHRLRAHTLATNPQNVRSSLSVPPPGPYHNHSFIASPPRTLDSDIARWIEERNILLQTGVYTHADSTIQKLDKKIQEALLEKKHNSSS